MEDLPDVVTHSEFIVNKFLLTYDPIAYQCLEEWIDIKASFNPTIDIVKYCRLPFVKKYSLYKSCARG